MLFSFHHLLKIIAPAKVWHAPVSVSPLALLALVVLPHCSRSNEGSPSETTSSARLSPTVASSIDPALDYASAYPWPPRYLLHYAGYDTLDALTGIAVDDDYVFFFQNNFLYRNALDADPEAEPVQMLFCGPICQPGEIQADGHYVYTLAGTDIHRYDRMDGSLTKIPLWTSHSNVGELAMDERYLYTALHGCAGIARYDKQTLQQVGDVLYADSPTYPNDAGHTTFAFAGNKIICAAPSNPTYVWDSWEAPVRMLGVADSMHGIAVMGDDVYRSTLAAENRDPGRLVRFPLDGAPSSTFEFPREGHNEIHGLPELNLVLLPFTGGFRRFSTTEQALLADFKTGRPDYMITVGDLVYATMASSRWYPELGTTHSAFWIARIPIADFGKF